MLTPHFRAVVASSLLLAAAGPPSAFSAEAAPPRLSPEELAAGWIQLFDGESLFGWKQVGGGNWRVEQGEIQVDAGEPGWLMTSVDWADYELHVEFKGPATTNSGVFLRSAEQPTDPTKDCVDVNIAPRDNPWPTPSLVGRARASIEHSSIRDPNSRYRGARPSEIPDPWDGQWHSLDIRLVGRECQLALDDAIPPTYFSETDDYLYLAVETPVRGRIGLQFKEGPIAFRNIRLKPLKLTPIFNGKDLTGWNTDQKKASEFSVTPDGELHIRNGRGQIESDGIYGDLALQLECFVNGDALNSGVFFRSIPRDFTNGYESQIQNAVIDGDPTKPVDCGTGGIYRRVSARRVNARDREWFAKTIVATGSQIAVWVNGLQVTDWTDMRPPRDNPREGLRTEPGTLSLQGHDPTTDIRFRNLRVVELPAKATAKD